MCNIKSLKGIRYNPKKVNTKNCIAPPYDVFNYGDSIDTALRSYPENIVHIQKPAGKGDTKYQNAQTVYEKFIKKNILIQEKKSGFYIINQSWSDSSRTGFMGLVKLDPHYQRIKPHEKTKPGPITDRLKLTKSTGLNIGPIFVIFEDDKREIAELLANSERNGDLLYNFKFPKKIKNRITFSQNKDIQKILNDKTLYIADGHHRYRTMLDYRNIMRKKDENPDGEKPYDYTMMFLVPSSEVKILAYHRLIQNVNPEKLQALTKILSENFNLTRKSKICRPDKGKIGFYFNGDYYVFTLPRGQKNLVPPRFLQDNILSKYLDISDKKMAEGDWVHFKPGTEKISEIKKEVDKSKYQAAFILNPLRFGDIKKVSDSGGTLPPKSTYFYPKIPSGIVLNKVS
ncbi:MAG: DUF1015 domain-containing protein [Elusimicrobiota bacterium]